MQCGCVRSGKSPPRCLRSAGSIGAICEFVFLFAALLIADSAGLIRARGLDNINLWWLWRPLPCRVGL